jgi:manganese/zinc/iron transport system substrate-binding protein
MPSAKWIALSAVALALAVLGCNRPTDSGDSSGRNQAGIRGRIRVTATVGMIADVAKEIGGPPVEVTALLGPGTDPHLYKAREKDIRLLARADLIFYNGLHLEGKLGDVIGKMARDRPVIAVSDRLPRTRLHRSAVAQGGLDPHVWFDVTLWMKVAERIRDALIEVVPQHRVTFSQRATDLLQRMETLHAWAKKETARIPKESRVLVTAHDAFGYFGTAYDVQVRGIQGINTEDEAGVEEINKLVHFIVRRKVKAVFVESTVPRKNIEALIEGCKAKGHEVRIGGELFSDAMGAAGTPEGSYIGMVKHNVTTIVNALL